MRKSCHFIIALVLIALWPAEAARSAYFLPEGPLYTGDGAITILNTHTLELETIKYKDELAEYLPDGIREIDRMLRCRLTGEKARMSLRLIELIDHIEDHFGAGRIEVVSGYRSQTLNGYLKAQGRSVARGSLHMQGEALDVKIPGVRLVSLRNYVRALSAGGVGFYPGRFVHIDVGPVRVW